MRLFLPLPLTSWDIWYIPQTQLDVWILLFLEIGSLVAQTGLRFAVKLKITLDFRSSCLHAPTPMLGLYVVYEVLGMKPRASSILGKDPPH